MKLKEHYTFKEKMWIYPSETSAWHFVTLPKDISAKIKELSHGTRRGFGSIPVQVTIGETIWDTSIFPDSRENSYILPVKASVRRHEGIYAGDKITVSLIIRKL